MGVSANTNETYDVTTIREAHSLNGALFHWRQPAALTV
jgi:hypothetical protein